MKHCLRYLWRNITTCPEKGLLENLNEFIIGESLELVRTKIENIGKFSMHFELSTSWQNNKLYRSYCFGELSSGNYNIGLNKRVIHNSNLLKPTYLYHESHLVDGITNLNPLLGGCTKINKHLEQNIWIAIDLKSEYIIKKINIYPSNDNGNKKFK